MPSETIVSPAVTPERISIDPSRVRPILTVAALEAAVSLPDEHVRIVSFANDSGRRHENSLRRRSQDADRPKHPGFDTSAFIRQDNANVKSARGRIDGVRNDADAAGPVLIRISVESDLRFLARFRGGEILFIDIAHGPYCW